MHLTPTPDLVSKTAARDIGPQTTGWISMQNPGTRVHSDISGEILCLRASHSPFQRLCAVWLFSPQALDISRCFILVLVHRHNSGRPKNSSSLWPGNHLDFHTATQELSISSRLHFAQESHLSGCYGSWNPCRYPSHRQFHLLTQSLPLSPPASFSNMQKFST